MTKIFDLIHLNNHVYAVDKTVRKLNKGDWHIQQKDNKIGVWQYLLGSGETPLWYWKIIATTHKSLGLPLLPEIEDDVTVLAEKRFPIGDTDFNGLFQGGFVEGYKAAKAKKYTEEETRELCKKSWDAYHHNDTFDEWWNENKKTDPLPKQVELEMEYDPTGITYHENDKAFKPKVKDGFVIVKRWIY